MEKRFCLITSLFLTIISLIVPNTGHSQSFVADSAFISIDSASLLLINGDTEFSGRSDLINDGTISVKGNWLNNNEDTLHSGKGKVILSGDTQLISGTSIQYFNDLHLLGTGNKYSDSSIIVSNSLYLNDKILLARNQNVFILNPDTSGIQDSTGYLDLGFNGELIRYTNTRISYKYPLGSLNNGGKRSAWIIPENQNLSLYGLSLYYDNPTVSGLPINNRADELCSINQYFYHRVNANSSVKAQIGISYNPLQDGSFNDLTNWASSQWESVSDVRKVTGNYNILFTDSFIDFSQVKEIALGSRISKPEIQYGASPYCYGDTIALSTNNQFSTYLWNNGETGNSINVTQEGYYQVYVDSQSLCSSYSDSVFLDFDTIATPQVLSLGNDSICDGDTVTLFTDKNYASYNWNTGQQTDSLKVFNIGAYAVTVTDSNGCVASSNTYNVFEYSPAQASIDSTGDLEFCAGDSVILSLSPDFSNVIWSNGNSGNQLVIKSTGSYWVQYATDSNGCAINNTPTVNTTQFALDEAVFDISNTSGLCADDSIQIGVINDYQNYTWNTGGQTNTIQTLAGGQFIINALDSNGCSISDTTNVVKSLRDTVKSLFKYVIKDSSIKFIDSSKASDNIYWSVTGLPSGSENSSDSVFTISTNNVQNLKVCLESWNNCFRDTICETIVISGIGEDYNAGYEVHLYPNPVHNTLNIAFSKPIQGEVEFILYDLLGKRLWSKFEQMNSKHTSIDLSQLASGPYLFETRHKELKHIKKINKFY